MYSRGHVDKFFRTGGVKADALQHAEGSRPECVRASIEVTTGVLD
jgi:hypothetical protein